MPVTDRKKPGSIIRQSKMLLWSVLIFSVFTNLLMLTGPLFMLQVYDRVLSSRSQETLVALFSLVVVLFVFFGLLEFARGRVMARVGVRFHAITGPDVFANYIDAAATRRDVEAARQSVQGIEAARSFLTSPVVLSLFDIPWTPIFFAAIFIFHPMLGWMSLAGGLALVIIALLNQIITSKMTGRAQRQSIAVSGFSKQAELGSELIRAQGMKKTMLARWQSYQDSALKDTLRANDWTGSFSAFTKSLRLLLQSAILALGAWLVLKNELSPGAMIAASILMGRALAPIEQIIGQWQVIQRGLSGARKANEFLLRSPSAGPVTDLPDPDANLVVKNLSVKSEIADSAILNNISVNLPAGQSIGVIGKSGSGKTTLARVIMGVVAATSGEIRLGGATLEQYGQERLGKLIGYLPQEVQFFDGTVAENIAHMSMSPNSEQVVAAAQKARVHDIIINLPNGYDTILGHSDVQLSGGQRQRLGLARALYHDPCLLVLDEPNSALDAEGSEALHKVVTAMKADQKSVIVMTHRPTAISACEELLVLDNGHAVAQGPRDQVIRAIMENASNVETAVAEANRNG